MRAAVRFGNNSNSDQYDNVARVDYLISSKQSFFGRATTNKLNQPTTYDGDEPAHAGHQRDLQRVSTLDFGGTPTWCRRTSSTPSAWRPSGPRLPELPISFFNCADLGMGSNFTDVGA